MSRADLLINEPPLQVLPSLAAVIGLNEAIVLQQLHYWIINPKNAGKVFEGHKWVFNTYEEWKENFPFWSTDTIKRTFLSLEERGLVVSKQLDKGEWNRKKFYRIAYEKMDSLHEQSCTLAPIEEGNLPPSYIGTTETTTETNKSTGEDSDLLSPEKKVLPGIEGAIFQGRPVTEEDVRASRQGDLYPGRSKLPEPIRELMDVFFEVSGIPWTAGGFTDLVMTGNTWLEMGVTPEYIREAYDASRPDPVTGKGGFRVGRPGALNTTLAAVMGERQGKGHKTVIQELDDIFGKHGEKSRVRG